MKIGILTYHRAHNYGAMLQAYALRSFLREQGHQVEFVDYWPKSHQKQYVLIKPIRGAKFINRAINLVSDCLTIIRRYIRMQKFNNFASNYLELKPKIKYTSNNSQIESGLYDYIIVGSDQVWRTQEYEGKYVGFDPMFFCQNVPETTRCITYAASMGIISMNDQDRQLLQQYLKAFDTILVRENTLKELINSLNYDADVVLDPTLLLTREQWNKQLPQASYHRRKYVLYYELIQSKDALKFATQKAKSMDCDLLIMNAQVHTIPRRNHISNASPIDFLHAIRDAEFVVATSFHGTAFSIIFEKQFITIGLSKNADRVKTLLQHLNISEHYQPHPASINNIDYTNIRPLLDKMKSKSQNLLLSALTK
jgi:polysaccharide pyruvyl transferase WcaK-like protein